MIRAISRTDTGLRRQNNEDSLLVLPAALVYCVADGMGGGEEGERASAIVCEKVAAAAAVPQRFFAARMAGLRDAVKAANAEIFTYARAHGYPSMGSTAVILAVNPVDTSEAQIRHVGDSRAYLLRGGRAYALTRDHSMAVELNRRLGGARMEGLEDRSNPISHVLTRAVGADSAIDVDERKFRTEPGDRVLLCSDGVHDVVSDEELGMLLSGLALEEADRTLAALVRERGAPDNFTYILVDLV